MALDFPANPTDGQVYGSYIYSSSKGVWQSREESAAVAVTSPTPPTSASNGDIWIDTSDGVAYFYYSDGNTSQWVELMSSGVTSLALKADRSYVDSQDALKANLSSPSFTGTMNAEWISANQRVTGTTPNNSGSTGGVAVKAPAGGTQTSAYLQFVNNAYSSQWGAIEATSSSELKLNASYVLLPSQPSFRCYGSNNYSSGTVTYNQTPVHNQGNFYNNSTGLFTAPVTGKYAFSASFFSLISSGGTMGYKINGGGWVALAGREGSEGYYEPYTLSTIVHMNANDYIGCYPYTGTIHLNSALNSFSGHFLG